ncbi:uncharacterized protein BDW47DRAFT_107819 [Aspergillus candidus]|uniref:Uncharacterized protein n=1 Tax=Aspergillus candidus TaxID=41067 RepID=A0A2I2F8B4_ASPCN|nr:hypothetical protein BDW47DRAFT_107819 [Aspergillus candidus]PLB36865.1 hypothetical protein BDW47DRAFT_107819 [Aspergillus candidus]
MRITSPKSGDKINLKEDWQVSWEDVQPSDGHEISLWLTHYTTDPAQHTLLDLGVDPTQQSCVTIPGKHRHGIDGGDHYRVWATRPDLKSWPPSILAESANFHVDNPVKKGK